MSCVAYLFGSGVQGFLPAWCARLGLGAHGSECSVPCGAPAWDLGRLYSVPWRPLSATVAWCAHLAFLSRNRLYFTVLIGRISPGGQAS